MAAIDEPRADLLIEDDIVTIDRGTVFATAKDRPVLFSALAWVDVLLTLDRGDFEPLGGVAPVRIPPEEPIFP